MTMPSCRLYLASPLADDVPAMIEALNRAAAAGDIAALLISAEIAAWPDARNLIAAAQSLGIAAIIEGDAALAHKLGADGVEIPGEPAAYTAARAKLGASAIVGTACGASRHAAMTMGEAGADYVALDAGLIGWWAGLFEVPCVAASPASPEEAAPLIAAGADFIRPAASIWQKPQLAAEYTRLIAEHAP